MKANMMLGCVTMAMLVGCGSASESESVGTESSAFVGAHEVVPSIDLRGAANGKLYSFSVVRLASAGIPNAVVCTGNGVGGSESALIESCNTYSPAHSHPAGEYKLKLTITGNGKSCGSVFTFAEEAEPTNVEQVSPCSAMGVEATLAIQQAS